jgi:CHAD domain-containing protein
MSEPNFLVQQWEKEQKTFSDNLQILQNNLSIDAIHDWRVTVKKLRSYEKLRAELTGKKDPGKTWNPTKELFSVLGRYRDLDMNLQLLTDNKKGNKNEYSTLKEFLQAAIPEAQERIKTSLDKYPAGEQVVHITSLCKALLSFTDVELIKKIRLLLPGQINKIRGHLKSLDNEAHLLRKRLKDIYYWLAISPRNSIIPFSLQKALEKILDRLGAWQDHRTLLAKISLYIKEFVPRRTSESEEYKKLEEKVKRKNSDSLDAIGKQIEKWLTRVPSSGFKH